MTKSTDKMIRVSHDCDIAALKLGARLTIREGRTVTKREAVERAIVLYWKSLDIEDEKKAPT